jgi:hypothetical protein
MSASNLPAAALKSALGLALTAALTLGVFTDGAMAFGGRNAQTVVSSTSNSVSVSILKTGKFRVTLDLDNRLTGKRILVKVQKTAKLIQIVGSAKLKSQGKATLVSAAKVAVGNRLLVLSGNRVLFSQKVSKIRCLASIKPTPTPTPTATPQPTLSPTPAPTPSVPAQAQAPTAPAQPQVNRAALDAALQQASVYYSAYSAAGGFDRFETITQRTTVEQIQADATGMQAVASADAAIDLVRTAWPSGAVTDLDQLDPVKELYNQAQILVSQIWDAQVSSDQNSDALYPRDRFYLQAKLNLAWTVFRYKSLGGVNFPNGANTYFDQMPANFDGGTLDQANVFTVVDHINNDLTPPLEEGIQSLIEGSFVSVIPGNTEMFDSWLRASHLVDIDAKPESRDSLDAELIARAPDALNKFGIKVGNVEIACAMANRDLSPFDALSTSMDDVDTRLQTEPSYNPRVDFEQMKADFQTIGLQLFQSAMTEYQARQDQHSLYDFIMTLVATFNIQVLVIFPGSQQA